MMMKKLSRRSFLVGAGITSAAVLVGCAPENKEGSESSMMPAVETWDLETEVLVVGAGGGGITAAAVALDQGSKVLVIEKANAENENGYGVTRSSGGNGCMVKDVAEAVKYLEASNLGLIDKAVENAWAEYGTSVTDWLDQHGINWRIQEGLGPDFPNFPGAAGLQAIQIADPDDPKNVRGGSYYHKVMIPYVKEKGGEIVLGTTATDLVLNENREVIGVIAKQGDKQIAIRALKAVILATGGFEGSAEMLANYARCFPVAGLAWPLNMGDGIKMCQAIGADLYHMNNVCSQGYGFQYPGFFEARTGINGANWPAMSYIFVNKLGKRFLCENPNKAGGPLGHRSYMDYNTYDNTNEQVDGGFRDTPFYAVFDSKVIEAGPIFAPTTNSGIRILDPVDGGLGEDWSADNQNEIEKGYILKADTLEELAAKINANSANEGYVMVPQNLVDTVAEYNEFCASGVDTAYERPATSNEKPNLVALDTAPFYALRLIPTLYSTCGGPRKNEKGQVLNTKGEVISRLYVSGVLGESAAQTYTVYGQNWSEIWNFGRIAGENAAAETLLS